MNTSKLALLLCAPALAASFTLAHAQQTASLEPPAALAAAQPEAPTPDFSTSLLPAEPQQPTVYSSAPPPPEHTDGQSQRILGILPNFRAVSANTHLPAQSVKEKFVTASEDSFDYSAAFLPTVLAVYNYGTNNTPEFGSGGVGFGRYLWHSLVDQTSENYFVEFIVPAIAREDTRFYTLGKGGFWKRSGYALSRVVITRSDSGRATFNAGEVIGAGAASGVSNLYYPRAERTITNTGKQWGTNVGLDAFGFMFKEFWPDINHHLFHKDNDMQKF